MTHGQRPHLAMLVGNLVVGDSRVLKSAESAVRAGYRVTIVGERNRTVTSFSAHEDIPIYRLSIPFERTTRRQAEEAFGSAANAWRSRLLAGMLQRDAADADAVERWYRGGPAQSTPADWVRVLVDTLIRRGTSEADAADGRVGAGSAGAETGTRRWRATAEWIRTVPAAAGRRDGASTVRGRYRQLWPQIEDYEEAFLRALVPLEPDLIHVHDRHPLPAADTYAAWRAAQGRPVRWVYDAHEWLPAVHFVSGERARAAWLAAERDVIRRADAVITVSEELAERMRRRHRLPDRPTVVVNAPSAGRHPMAPTARRTLREECGLDAATPLLVYVGKLSESRGIFDAVDALPKLPGTHLAFVGNPDRKLRERLRESAAELGVDDRVHLHDYVPARNVTWYVASATVGLSPLHPTTAHEAAVPTKIREYIQSGLPLVVSDLAAQASFVREHGLGTVHSPGDPRDLARAVAEALDDVDRFRARSTDEFVLAHTWEGSESVLEAVWGRLHPDGPATAGAGAGTGVAGSEARDWLVVGPVTPALRAILGTAAELAETDGARPEFRSIDRPAAPERPDLFGRLPGLPEATAAVSEIARGTKAVVLGDGLPALNGHAGSPEAERLILEALGARSVAVLDPDALFSRRRLREAKPDHPLLDLSGPGATRYDKQTARIRESLRHGQWPVLTWGELAARQFPEAAWLPYPAPRSWTDGRAQEHRPVAAGTGGPARVLLAGVRRSAVENRQLADAAAAWRADGIEVVELPQFAPGAPVPEALQDSVGRPAVVVDALASGEPSPVAVMAWAHGLPVVGGAPHPLREDLARTAPLIVTGLADLQESVVRAAAELAEETTAAEHRAAALAYVERVHRQEFLSRFGRAVGTA